MVLSFEVEKNIFSSPARATIGFRWPKITRLQTKQLFVASFSVEFIILFYFSQFVTSFFYIDSLI